MKIIVFSYDAGLLPFYPIVTMMAASPYGAPPRGPASENLTHLLAVHQRSLEAVVLRTEDDFHNFDVNRIDDCFNKN